MREQRNDRKLKQQMIMHEPSAVHSLLISAGAVLFLSMTLAPPAFAQQETLQSLKDSLFDLDQEVQLLQHVLEASTVDPRALWNTNLRSWRMNNPALRDSLFSVFVETDSSVQSEAGAEAVVLSTTQDDVVEVRFGNAVFKGVALKRAIDQSGDRHLYSKVAQSYRYSQNVELRDPSITIPTEFRPESMDVGRLTNVSSQEYGRTIAPPHTTLAVLDLSGLMVRVGKDWGEEIRLGFDDANLPFWSSGTVQLLTMYDMVKVGLVLPIRGGLHETSLLGPLVLRPRRINGAPGFAASADFGTVGGSLAFLRMNSDNLTSLTDPSDFYYLSGYMELWSSFGITISPNSRARAKFGLGMHHINHARTIQDQNTAGFAVLDENESFGPYVSLEYVRTNEAESMRLGVQFYDLTVSLFGSIDIIPETLSIEARYLWPVASSLRPWENPEFFFISPKLRLTF
jgi:hypothetical protein